MDICAVGCENQAGIEINDGLGEEHNELCSVEQPMFARRGESNPGTYNTESCKNTPAKFRKSLSTCSAASPKIALWRNISTRHSPNLAGMFLHNSVQGVSD